MRHIRTKFRFPGNRPKGNPPFRYLPFRRPFPFRPSEKLKPGIDTRLSLCCPRCFSDGLFLPARRAARLNHDIDPFARLAARRLAAADGIDFGAGVVGDDRALGLVAAARYFGVAAQFDDVAGRGVFDLAGLAVYRSFAAV